MNTQPYSINLAPAFDFLELIDVEKLIAECKEEWYNQTLCQVNDCIVRLGVLHGEFHWHKHDAEDEFFMVLQGKLLIDLENEIININETVVLEPHQGFTIPKGVIHRTRAPEKVAVMMIEGAGVKPTGD